MYKDNLSFIHQVSASPERLQAITKNNDDDDDDGKMDLAKTPKPLTLCVAFARLVLPRLGFFGGARVALFYYTTSYKGFCKSGNQAREARRDGSSK
jgi:hypothetical protein